MLAQILKENHLLDTVLTQCVLASNGYTSKFLKFKEEFLYIDQPGYYHFILRNGDIIRITKSKKCKYLNYKQCKKFYEYFIVHNSRKFIDIISQFPFVNIQQKTVTINDDLLFSFNTSKKYLNGKILGYKYNYQWVCTKTTEYVVYKKIDFFDTTFEWKREAIVVTRNNIYLLDLELREFTQCSNKKISAIIASLSKLNKTMDLIQTHACKVYNLYQLMRSLVDVTYWDTYDFGYSSNVCDEDLYLKLLKKLRVKNNL